MVFAVSNAYDVRHVGVDVQNRLDGFQQLFQAERLVENRLADAARPGGP